MTSRNLVKLTSRERVKLYREKQLKEGRQLVSLYLHPDTIIKLRKLAKGRSRGKVIEQIIATM